MRFRAKHVSIGESGGEYFQVSFDNEDPSDDDLDLSPPDQPYLLVRRQFEDDDGGVCYIETLDHDTYTGHYRLRLIEFTPTRLAFEIIRKHHKYVEVTFTSTRSVSVKSNASCASFWAREPDRRRLAKGDGWVAPCEICHRKDRKADHRPRMMVILSNRGARPCQTTKPAC